MCVAIDGVWIGNLIDYTHTDPRLLIIVTVSLIHALHSSLEHALSLLSPLCVHQSLLGSGFQRRMLPLLWVPAISPCLNYQLLTATAHKD
jgi:hypothetical protein